MVVKDGGIIFSLSLVARGVMIICQEIFCRHIIFTHPLGVLGAVELDASFSVGISCAAWLKI